MGTPGRLILQRPSNQYSSSFFSLGQGWRHFWGHTPKLWTIFRQVLSHVESLSVPASYFQLFQWRLKAPYRLVHQGGGQLGHPLDQPCTHVTLVLFALYCNKAHCDRNCLILLISIIRSILCTKVVHSGTSLHRSCYLHFLTYIVCLIWSRN